MTATKTFSDIYLKALFCYQDIYFKALFCYQDISFHSCQIMRAHMFDQGITVYEMSNCIH